MADLSFSYNPSDISGTSDVASDAQSKIATVSDAASDALSKITTVSDAASSALAAASDAASKASDAASKASDALSQVSNALSKATAGSAAASDALSKITVVSGAASDAASAASDALSKASDASSAVAARSAIWDKKTVILKVYEEDGTVSTADAVMHFTCPDTLSGMNLVSCGAHLYTASTSGAVQVDLRKITSGASGTDMLTSCMQIDATEKDTATGASSAVIDTGNDDVAVADPIAVDVTAGGSGASGLEVRMTFEKP